MKLTQKLANNLSVKSKNRNKFRNILEIAKNGITKQGRGCFIEGQGVAYYNPKDNTKDVISILRGKVIHAYGVISDDTQKPVVRELIAKFGIDISLDNERVKFIQFLQDLQDAHDVVFDRFENKEPEVNLISRFRGECNQIAFNYKLV